MVKAIFFDWFNTLARFEPPRENSYRRAFQEFGIDISLKDVCLGVAAGDRYYFAENVRKPVRDRSPDEQVKLYVCYPQAILAQAKISAPADLPLNIIKKLMGEFKSITMVLFEDVLPACKALKERKLTLGVVTNADKSVNAMCERLGLKPYLDFIVTSQEVGAEKPAAPIFLAALQRAGVKASEAIHVGDQYNIDVVGARGAGIKPILIDRYNICTEVNDVPRITGLNELAQYL